MCNFLVGSWRNTMLFLCVISFFIIFLVLLVSVYWSGVFVDAMIVRSQKKRCDHLIMLLPPSIDHESSLMVKLRVYCYSTAFWWKITTAHLDYLSDSHIIEIPCFIVWQFVCFFFFLSRQVRARVKLCWARKARFLLWHSFKNLTFDMGKKIDWKSSSFCFGAILRHAGLFFCAKKTHQEWSFQIELRLRSSQAL